MSLSLLAVFVGICSAASPTFEEFVALYDKVYSSSSEFLYRKSVYEYNVAAISSVNSRQSSYQLRVNKFADLAQSEFSSKFLGLAPRESLLAALPRKSYLGRFESTGKPVPESVDWTSLGAVTAVKNQGHCGSCYAFATTGALEGRLEIVTGKLLPLSEQQIVDCSEKEGNQGCNGGLMDFGFEYVMEDGLCSESDYAYSGKEGKCSACKNPAIPPHKLAGYKDVHEKDPVALMEALSEGPVAVAIEADEMSFQFYHSGILTAECGAKLDHGVLAVGYGEKEGVKFWKVKNSWGPEWGVDGFILLGRDSSIKNETSAGECGILLGASFPIFNSLLHETTADQYEKPPCASSERAVQLEEFPGLGFCAPPCSASGTCPSPAAGVHAAPQCALQQQGSNEKFCALICRPKSAGCQSGAQCIQVQQGVGVCMFKLDNGSNYDTMSFEGLAGLVDQFEHVVALEQ